jgi:hypothetical protein
MLTPYQQELLRELENEIDEYLAQSSHLDAFLSRLKGLTLYEVGGRIIQARTSSLRAIATLALRRPRHPQR